MHSPNSLPATPGTPEIVTDAQGYQQIRIPLVTETGTVVYADLSPFNAKRLADGIGRIAYAARQHNQTHRGPIVQEEDPLKAGILKAIRDEGGLWGEERLTRFAASIGYHLVDLEPLDILNELVDEGTLRRVRGGYVTA
ncbi:hypothetical protein [Streptomyces sp. NPDC048551]|uniref:hypothetical protein n=1 Tax=Streptomyces sp. NPDC048551 TaxID=3155758 RepID=UPI003440C659